MYKKCALLSSCYNDNTTTTNDGKIRIHLIVRFNKTPDYHPDIVRLPAIKKYFSEKLAFHKSSTELLFFAHIYNIEERSPTQRVSFFTFTCQLKMSVSECPTV